MKGYNTMEAGGPGPGGGRKRGSGMFRLWGANPGSTGEDETGEGSGESDAQRAPRRRRGGRGVFIGNSASVLSTPGNGPVGAQNRAMPPGLQTPKVFQPYSKVLNMGARYMDALRRDVNGTGRLNQTIDVRSFTSLADVLGDDFADFVSLVSSQNVFMRDLVLESRVGGEVVAGADINLGDADAIFGEEEGGGSGGAPFRGPWRGGGGGNAGAGGGASRSMRAMRFMGAHYPEFDTEPNPEQRAEEGILDAASNEVDVDDETLKGVIDTAIDRANVGTLHGGDGVHPRARIPGFLAGGYDPANVAERITPLLSAAIREAEALLFAALATPGRPSPSHGDLESVLGALSSAAAGGAAATGAPTPGGPAGLPGAVQAPQVTANDAKDFLVRLFGNHRDKLPSFTQRTLYMLFGGSIEALDRMKASYSSDLWREAKEMQHELKLFREGVIGRDSRDHAVPFVPSGDSSSDADMALELELFYYTAFNNFNVGSEPANAADLFLHPAPGHDFNEALNNIRREIESYKAASEVFIGEMVRILHEPMLFVPDAASVSVSDYWTSTTFLASPAAVAAELERAASSVPYRTYKQVRDIDGGDSMLSTLKGVLYTLVVSERAEVLQTAIPDTGVMLDVGGFTFTSWCGSGEFSRTVRSALKTFYDVAEFVSQDTEGLDEEDVLGGEDWGGMSAPPEAQFREVVASIRKNLSTPTNMRFLYMYLIRLPRMRARGVEYPDIGWTRFQWGMINLWLLCVFMPRSFSDFVVYPLWKYFERVPRERRENSMRVKDAYAAVESLADAESFDLLGLLASEVCADLIESWWRSDIMAVMAPGFLRDVASHVVRIDAHDDDEVSRFFLQRAAGVPARTLLGMTANARSRVRISPQGILVPSVPIVHLPEGWRDIQVTLGEMQRMLSAPDRVVRSVRNPRDEQEPEEIQRPHENMGEAFFGLQLETKTLMAFGILNGARAGARRINDAVRVAAERQAASGAGPKPARNLLVTDRELRTHFAHLVSAVIHGWELTHPRQARVQQRQSQLTANAIARENAIVRLRAALASDRLAAVVPAARRGAGGISSHTPPLPPTPKYGSLASFM